MHCDYGYMGMHFFWWIFWLLILAGLIYLFYKIVDKNKIQADRSFQILKERYAKGEITEEEYLSKKKRLEE